MKESWAREAARIKANEARHNKVTSDVLRAVKQRGGGGDGGGYAVHGDGSDDASDICTDDVTPPPDSRSPATPPGVPRRKTSCHSGRERTRMEGQEGNGAPIEELLRTDSRKAVTPKGRESENVILRSKMRHGRFGTTADSGSSDDETTRSLLRAARDILSATPKGQLSYIVVKRQLAEIFGYEEIEKRKGKLRDLMTQAAGVSTREVCTVESLMDHASVTSEFSGSFRGIGELAAAIETSVPELIMDESQSTYPSWLKDVDEDEVAEISDSPDDFDFVRSGLGDAQCMAICRGLDVGGQCLRVLILKDSHIDEDGLESLLKYRYASKLQHLDLTRCERIGNKAMEAIARSCGVGLRIIVLSSCFRVTDEGVKALAKSCKNLAYVDVQRCSELTDISVSTLIEACLGLETLLLKGCKRLTNASFLPLQASKAKVDAADKKGNEVSEGRRRISFMLATIACDSLDGMRKSGGRLVHVDLSGCRHIDDGALVLFSKCSQWLEELRLEEASKVTDAGIAALTKKCSNLRFVSLNRCVRITDVSVAHLVRYCPNLSELNMYCCSNITDVALHTIGGLGKVDGEDGDTPRRRKSSLRSLNLKLCPQITDDGIVALSRGCPALSQISLQRGRITDVGIHALVTNCPTLRFLEFGLLPGLTDKSMVQISENSQNIRAMPLL
eukprot:g3301.t1